MIINKNRSAIFNEKFCLWKIRLRLFVAVCRQKMGFLGTDYKSVDLRSLWPYSFLIKMCFIWRFYRGHELELIGLIEFKSFQLEFYKNSRYIIPDSLIRSMIMARESFIGQY